MKDPKLSQQYFAIKLMILLSVIDDPVGKRETAFGCPYSEDLLVRIDQKIDISGVIEQMKGIIVDPDTLLLQIQSYRGQVLQVRRHLLLYPFWLRFLRSALS